MKADDDFGVRQLQMVYSVNGGPQKTIALFGGAQAAAREVSAGHTIYLEELGLQPGDFVSYFAKATDNAQTASSDIYFVQIRPFKKDYKQAQSQAQAGGGGGGGGGDVGELSRQQREIVAATFNTDSRQGEDQGGQVPRERGLPQPRPGQAARAGRGARSTS